MSVDTPEPSPSLRPWARTFSTESIATLVCVDEPTIALEAILFAEFDNVHGPVIAHQWPLDFIPQGDCARDRMETAQDLGLYGTYLIPHEALSGHISTWTHGLHTFLSYPTTFQDPKYFRNVYRSNLIFVFPSTGSDHVAYHSVIRRVSQAFQMLERDFEWVSRQSRTATLAPKTRDPPDMPTPNKEVKRDEEGLGSSTSYEDMMAVDEEPRGVVDMLSITDVLQLLVDGLNERNEVVIPFDKNGVILTFKVFARIPDPVEVNTWDVPILLHKPSQDEISDWDLSLQMIVPILSDQRFGNRTVAVIAHALSMSPATCCFAVRHLVYFGYVRTIDIFQYSNYYTLVPHSFAVLASGTVDSYALRFVSCDASDPVSQVSLTNFYQSFGMNPLHNPVYHRHGAHCDTTRSSGYKRVQEVLQYLDDGIQGGQVAGRVDRAERRFERWRTEWKTDLKERLSVRHASMAHQTLDPHSCVRRALRLPETHP
eukprot:TRINITY_DN2689_c0_g1_i4.p1 TRINITY_DN2689_c0_g1~~TRINITY_DN2689_c0_g1_i4.p1  ORF type:complete len:484 (+),score=135.32 TRINITY_DN2689_c0_g1_i4:722-2173(+)